MSQRPSGPPSTYPVRILIPTTQLSYLDYLYPNLQVIEMFGAGSFSDKRWVKNFLYGSFNAILTGKAEVSWKAAGFLYTATLSAILADMRLVTTVADAVLDKVVFYEKVIVHNHATINDITLRFEKGNIHPYVLRNLVVGTPAYPLQAVYQVLVNLKNALRALPKDLRRHWKPGY